MGLPDLGDGTGGHRKLRSRRPVSSRNAAGRIFKQKVQSRTAVECRRQISFIARKRILHDRLNV